MKKRKRTACHARAKTPNSVQRVKSMMERGHPDGADPGFWLNFLGLSFLNCKGETSTPLLSGNETREQNSKVRGLGTSQVLQR